MIAAAPLGLQPGRLIARYLQASQVPFDEKHQCCARCNVLSDLRAAGLPGAAYLMLADGVAHLDPASAVFEAILEGWAAQQQA